MRRSFQLLVLVFTLAAIFAVGWLSTQKNSPFYQPIKNYELVTPISQLTPVEIDKVIAPYLGDSFWDIPLTRIQADLIHLDWVEFAEIKRKWPNLLFISITEQIPVARWGENGLVNRSGEVFFPTSISGFENLVQLNASLEYSELVLKRFVNLQKELKTLGLIVASFSLTTEKVWKVAILNGPEIVIDELSYEDKLQRFMKAYPGLSKEMRNSARIYDLRYSNGFIVAQN